LRATEEKVGEILLRSSTKGTALLECRPLGMEVGLKAKNAKSCLHDVFPACEVSYMKVSWECVQFGYHISAGDDQFVEGDC
jgi:hypothetical protein